MGDHGSGPDDEIRNAPGASSRGGGFKEFSEKMADEFDEDALDDYGEDDRAGGDVRASMQRMTSAFVHQAEDVVTAQQSMVAGVLRDIATSLRQPDRAAFRSETQRFLGAGADATPVLVSAFANALDTSADRVESIDINRVAGEASRFLREQPFAAAGLAALAGLALARFARTASR